MGEKIWSHEDFSYDSARLIRRDVTVSEESWSLVTPGGQPVYLTREALLNLRNTINRELYWFAGTPGEEDESDLAQETPKSSEPDPWVDARNDIMRMRVAIEGIAATMSRADLLKAQADAVDTGAVPPLCLSEEVSGRQCTRPLGHTSSHYSEEVEEETPQAQADAVGSGYNQNLSPDDDRERCGGMSVLGDQCVLTDGHDGVHDYSILQSPRCTASYDRNRCIKPMAHLGYHMWAPAPSDDEGWKR